MNDLLQTSGELGIVPAAIFAKFIIVCVVVLGLLRTLQYPDQIIRYLWAAMIALPAVLVVTRLVTLRPWSDILSVLSLSLAILSLVINRPNRWANAHRGKHEA